MPEQPVWGERSSTKQSLVTQMIHTAKKHSNAAFIGVNRFVQRGHTSMAMFVPSGSQWFESTQCGDCCEQGHRWPWGQG